MVWNTGLQVNVFNVLKAAIVFLIIKPLTFKATEILSNYQATTVIHNHDAAHINTLGLRGAFVDGLVLARPTTRDKRSVFRAVLLVILAFWIGTAAEVLFEFGVDAMSQQQIASTRVNTTAGRSDSIFYTPGRYAVTDRIARLEMACQQHNTLSTFVDVFTLHADHLCGTPTHKRTVCASGFDLLGQTCMIPAVLQRAVVPAAKGWTSETWIHLLFVSTSWTFVSDGTHEDNGFVTFSPRTTFHSDGGGQIFSTVANHAVPPKPFSGVRAIHCGSGSSLNRTGERMPGGRPFQICLWEFDHFVLLTNADWLRRRVPDDFVEQNRNPEEPSIIVPGPGRESESVRSVLAPLTGLEVSTIGRWVSIEKNGSLSNRDIMTTMGLLRALMVFSFEDSAGFHPDTFEVGMWATGSMSLRLAERAVALGIAFENSTTLVERRFHKESRQVATVDLRLLAVYLGSIVLFAGSMFVLNAVQSVPVQVDLSLEAVLGWWQVERRGYNAAGVNPRAHVLGLAREFEKPRITVM